MNLLTYHPPQVDLQIAVGGGFTTWGGFTTSPAILALTSEDCGLRTWGGPFDKDPMGWSEPFDKGSGWGGPFDKGPVGWSARCSRRSSRRRCSSSSSRVIVVAIIVIIVVHMVIVAIVFMVVVILIILVAVVIVVIVCTAWNGIAVGSTV